MFKDYITDIMSVCWGDKNILKYIMMKIILLYFALNYYAGDTKDFQRFKNRTQTRDAIVKSNAKFGEKKQMLTFNYRSA